MARIALQSPTVDVPLEIPERFQNVFIDLDDNGLHSLQRGNGIYELIDAPLHVLRDKIRDLNLELNPEEDVFLKENFGIYSDLDYFMDPQVAQSWINRWTLTKTTQTNTTDTSRIEIRITYERTPRIPAHILQDIEASIKGIYIKLLQAAEISTEEIPLEIHFANVSSPFYQSDLPQALRQEATALLNSCKNYSENVGRSTTGNVGHLRQGIQNIFTSLCEKRLQGGKIVLTLLILRSLADSYKKNRRATNPSAALNFLAHVLAHELSHLLSLANFGNLYTHKKASLLVEGIKIAAGEKYDTMAYCFLAQTEKFSAWFEHKELDNMVDPSYIASITQVFHEEELDMDLTGYYIAQKAGFNLLEIEDNIPHAVQSRTHPNRKERVSLLHTLSGAD